MIMSGSPIRLKDGRLARLLDAWTCIDTGSPVVLMNGNVTFATGYKYHDGPLPEITHPGSPTVEYRAEVRVGMAWLDSRYLGWSERVNWATLDMQYRTRDIPAQLKLDTDDLSRNDMCRLGFFVNREMLDRLRTRPESAREPGYRRDVWDAAMEYLAYNHLTRAWWHAAHGGGRS